MKILATFVLIIAVIAPLFLFPAAAQADIYTFPGSVGPVVIPDGSTVTNAYVMNGSDPLPFNVVDFTLPDATGNVTGEVNDFMMGNINFTNPVSDLIFTWIGGAGTEVFANNGLVADCPPSDTSGCMATVDLGSAFITQLSFDSPFEGLAGIESLTYVDPDPVSDHEPSVLWMLITIPLMLLGLSRWAQLNLRKLSKR